MSEKFLLCRPRGGLNDSLVQVYKCLQYAEKYHRNLVIDACKSGLMGDFDEFFVLKSDVVNIYPRLTNELKEELARKSFFPALDSSTIFSYTAAFDTRIKNYSDKESGKKLTFSFHRNYRADVLLHEQCGGGNAAGLFRQMDLSPITQKFVVERLSMLPASYTAIHVRNTDYQTDYKNFFTRIDREKVGPNVLICSDDNEVIDFARQYFKDKHIYTVTDAAVSTGEPLHRHHVYDDDAERIEATRRAITDLLGLANADHLYFDKVNHGGILGKSRLAIMLNGKVSGFSRLAQSLGNKKGLVDRLLS